MQADVATLSADTAPTGKPVARLISIPFLLLRSSTAAGAVAMGFVQTFVFARVLSPDRFSIFIVVGAIGYTLWLCDLGLAKILFVALRKGHLAGRPDPRAAAEATAVTLFYVALAITGSLACFAVMASRPSFSIGDAADFALFFLFISINLPWFSLRTIAIAVDEYVFYEKLELVRRLLNMTTMLAILAGLPFTAFLIGSNALWAALLAAATVRLTRRGALAPRVRDFAHQFALFVRSNSRSIARSGTYALSDIFIYTFPYYVVPAAFGLGAPPIILEATFRIFRGTSMIYAAACDLALPGQTRAVAAHDVTKLWRATLIAAGLCCIPAAFACALLIVAAQPLFVLLLHSAATVPAAITPILVVLLSANLVQMVAQSLLLHTGYFRELGRISAAVAAAMIAATAWSVAAEFDIVGFLAAYAAVYTAGALAMAIAALRGPVRAAAHRPGGMSAERFRTGEAAPQAPPAISARQDTAHRTPLPSQNP
jgi:O-antigen/teichoic acid export membrane protein